MDEDPSSLLMTIAAFVPLLLLSGFFSAAEVSFVSLSSAKTRSLVEEEPGRLSRLIAQLKSAPDRLLTTILIGNNVVNVLTASLATVVATRVFGSAGLGIATGVVTIALLIFGEILPKGFAQRYPVVFAKIAAYPLFFLDRVLHPVVWLFEKMFYLVGGTSRERITEEELLAAVDIGHESGEIQAHERELIQNVLDFTDTRVEEVMTPRVNIDAVERSKTVREVKYYFVQHRHNRLPVYDQSIDKVIGIVNLRHILEHRGEQDLPVAALELKEPIFTPASRPIRSLFQEFKSRQTHIAIVVDEHGGTQGLVTLEDLLEELVGEIEDEQDIPERGIRRVNKSVLDVPGDASLADIDSELETRLATGEFENKNVAFLILEKLGRIPKINDRLRVDDEVELTVEEVLENRITRVKVEKI